jgi:molecular chaperone HtpG
MMDHTFPMSIDLVRILRTLSAQIYDTHLAFLRENVQNAVDAVRLQARRDGNSTRSENYRITVEVSQNIVKITDNGVGMTLEEQRNFFWRMGASSKRTKEARSAGCIGHFGIGGVANIGVCKSVKISSRSVTDKVGHWTRLCESDLRQAVAIGAMPNINHGKASDQRIRGTVVEAELYKTPDVAELEAYLEECVRYASELVTFNGVRLSQQVLRLETEVGRDLRALSDERGVIVVTKRRSASSSHGVHVGNVRCRWFEDDGHRLYAQLLGITAGGRAEMQVNGFIKSSSGQIEIRRRGFKICDTRDPAIMRIPSLYPSLGLSGVIDSDQLQPIAGRESLDEESEALLSSLLEIIRDAAFFLILDSPDRVAQYPEIYGYMMGRDEYLEYLGTTRVRLTGGDESTLTDVRAQFERGIRIYYSRERNGTVARHLKAHGGIVVELSDERVQARAVRQYLEAFCKSVSADEQIECLEEYPESSFARFDRVFIGELEDVIVTNYQVRVGIQAGRLSSNLAAYATQGTDGVLRVHVDLRHPEVTKMHKLNSTMLQVATRAFCQQFFGEALKKASPRFFGDGSLNFDFFKERAEEWILVRGEIVEFGRSDIHEIRADEQQPDLPPGFAPKLMHILGGYKEFQGYYLRMPGGLVKGFQNEIVDLELRAAMWGGNRVTLIASDGIEISFNVDIKLDGLVRVRGGGLGLPGSTTIDLGTLTMRVIQNPG